MALFEAGKHMAEESRELAVQRAEVKAGGEVAGLIPQSVEEAYRLAVAISKSGLAPPSMATPEKCLVAIIAGAEIGLAPFQAVQGFAVINNRPVLWGDAMIAVVRSKGFRVREWLHQEGGDDALSDAQAAYCEVIRPDTAEVIVRRFSVADAKRAKLWDKANTPWITYPTRMLQMRARAYALRDAAADVLKGFAMREEVQDIEVVEEAPVSTLRERLEANKEPRAEGFNVENPEEELIAEIEPIGGERPLRREDYASDADFEDAVMSKPRAEYDGPNVDARAAGELSATEAATPASGAGTEAGTPATGDDTSERVSRYVDALEKAPNRIRLRFERDRAHDLLSFLAETDEERHAACDAVFNRRWAAFEDAELDRQPGR